MDCTARWIIYCFQNRLAWNILLFEGSYYFGDSFYFKEYINLMSILLKKLYHSSDYITPRTISKSREELDWVLNRHNPLSNGIFSINRISWGINQKVFLNSRSSRTMLLLSQHNPLINKILCLDLKYLDFLRGMINWVTHFRKE